MLNRTNLSTLKNCYYIHKAILNSRFVIYATEYINHTYINYLKSIL